MPSLNQRMKKAVGVVNLQVGRDALRAEAAFVDGEVVARLEAYDVFALDEQVHAALHGAVRAVRRHDLVNHAVGAPAPVRLVVQVRPELLDYLL
jgi:hypothetical protein